MAKSVLICGASGFIGKNLANYFLSKQSEYDVTLVEHETPLDFVGDYAQVIKGDLRNPEFVKKALSGIDIVLQFAATTSGSKVIVNTPHVHVTDNAVMNSLILREAYEQSIEHVVFPSCTVMYQPSETALKETDFDGRDRIYDKYFGVGNTKVYIEKMCEFYSGLGRTKHTVIRHSNIYGPHDKFDIENGHVCGATIWKAFHLDEIVVWGTGEEKRDLLHVNDLVSFVEKSICNQESDYGLYNVGLGEAISVKNLVEKINILMPENTKPKNISYDTTKPTIPTSLFLDCSKAKEELGWEPNYGLETGLSDTINWYANDLEKDKKRYYGRRGAGTLIVSRRTKRVLMAKRSDKVNIPLTWASIGGGIEGDENNTEKEISLSVAKMAAHTEIAEETEYDGDIDLNFLGLLRYEDGMEWEKGGKNFTTYMYIGFVELEFQAVKNWETEEFRWVHLDEIESLGELHPCTKRTLEETAFKNIVQNL